MHLAQVNVALMKYPPADQRMAELIHQIPEVNRLADSAPGFVWRLAGELITANTLAPLTWMFQPFEPDKIFYNMSVWAGAEQLREFIYRTAHVSVMRDKHRWIDPAFAGPPLALWWIEPGHQPTIRESAERLLSLQDHGPTDFAFTFRSMFPSSGVHG